MKKRVGKLLYWSPRILSILFVLFLALFSLDVFGNGYSFWQTALALFMHNIPVIILAILLIISWKYEIVGAMTFASAGLLYIFLSLFKNQFQWYYLSWAVQISGPAFFVSWLFYLNWIRKKK